MPPQNKKRTWEEIVKDSNGTSFFLPEKLIEEAKEWKKKNDAFFKKCEALAKDEIEKSVAYNALMLKIRQYIADTGADIWQKEIGFDNYALKDGKFVINTREMRE
jgi:hypothetical protein